MPEHDFSALFDQYPDIISNMPERFTSHQFILELASRNQDLYVEALYAYRHHVNKENPAPFMIVHGRLAKELYQFSEIAYDGEEKNSIDIFGHTQACARWKKVK